MSDKIEIKDDYICQLRLQITNLEKQHEQDNWRLQQVDDLLEMVEKERDEEEAKYKGINFRPVFWCLTVLLTNWKIKLIKPYYDNFVHRDLYLHTSHDRKLFYTFYSVLDEKIILL